MRALCLTVALALVVGHALAQAPLPPEPRTPPLLLGAAWYPEQWPESAWERDLVLMEAAGIHFVRVAEFAWARMEPTEDHFDFTWLDHAIRAAERHHIAIVLGTPGATPPAWLTTHYPDTLRTLADGRRDSHGNRQQADFGSPKYRELLRTIVDKMAARYGHDANVIGWQLDNEIGNESYGANNRADFDAWLHQKYGTLDDLNRRWTTQYWSESYTDWAQIPIEESYGNPGLLLNWKQFVSDTWRSYDKLQIDAIRAHAEPRQKITTNMMGLYNAYDHYTVAQDLDFVSWDFYVGHGHLNPVSAGFTHDVMRGLLRKNFWVMETQPGHVNWSDLNNDLDKGEVRAMAWNDVAHGAEAVSYWQWRSALNGQEEIHGTLAGPEGEPVPVYDEIKQLGAEFAQAGPVLAGTTVKSEVALLYDYPSRWSIEWQRHIKSFDPIASALAFYAPLRALTHAVDVVSDTAPLAGYKLVVAPALNLLTPAAAKNLEAYVRGGGHLVLGQRSGLKDEDNSLAIERQPGPLAPLLGARVEQYYALDKPVPVTGEWGSGASTLWAERLTPASPETKVLMRYGKSNGWLDGEPAAVTRTVGKGRITYIGAALDATTMHAAAAWMVRDAGAQTLMPNLPEGVDLSVREGAGRRVFLLENFSAGPQTVALPAAMQDVLGKGTVSSVSLAQYGVAILQTQDQ